MTGAAVRLLSRMAKSFYARERERQLKAAQRRWARVAPLPARRRGVPAPILLLAVAGAALPVLVGKVA